ncbi:hypothetical protein CL619_02270 [archaeon]|nr:hypothetical protein [archaeon]|tara:strand:- start:1867 stop:2838 length:972 start_codon:yes stop_codon:yes gene_type:complete
MAQTYDFPGPSHQSKDQPWLRVVGYKKDVGFSRRRLPSNPTETEYWEDACRRFINRGLYVINMGKQVIVPKTLQERFESAKTQRHQELFGTGVSNTSMTHGLFGVSEEEIAAAIAVRRRTLNITAKAIANSWQRQLDFKRIGAEILVYDTWDPDTKVIRDKLPDMGLLSEIWHLNYSTVSVEEDPQRSAVPATAWELANGTIVLNSCNANHLRMGNFSGDPNCFEDREFLGRYFSEKGPYTAVSDINHRRNELETPLSDLTEEVVRLDQSNLAACGLRQMPLPFEIQYLEAMQKKYGGKSWEMGFDMSALDNLNYLTQVGDNN